LSDTVGWSSKQMASEINGEVVLLNIGLGRYYSLNDIGSRIWRMLETPRKVEDLCHLLTAKYKAESITVTSDVLALLNKLREEQLIDVVNV